MTHKEKESLCNARDDLLNHPSFGPWKIDIDFACIENKSCRPLLQAASLLPSRDIPVSLLQSYLSTVCEGSDDQNFDAALHLMKEQWLLSHSKDGASITLHPLIQQTIQPYIVDKDSERESVLSYLSTTLVHLFPSLEKVQTRHKVTDCMKYSPHLFHVASLILDCHCKSPAAQTAVDLACELSIQIHNIGVACFGRLTSARRCGNKQRLVEGEVVKYTFHCL